MVPDLSEKSFVKSVFGDLVQPFQIGAFSLRGCARVTDGARAMETPEAPVPRLLGAGHVTFTVDQGADTERYQGITELISDTVTNCARNYFCRSEQLYIAAALAARPGTGAGGGVGHSAPAAGRWQRRKPGLASSRDFVEHRDDRRDT